MMFENSVLSDHGAVHHGGRLVLRCGVSGSSWPAGALPDSWEPQCPRLQWLSRPEGVLEKCSSSRCCFIKLAFSQL